MYATACPSLRYLTKCLLIFTKCACSRTNREILEAERVADDLHFGTADRHGRQDPPGKMANAIVLVALEVIDQQRVHNIAAVDADKPNPSQPSDSFSDRPNAEVLATFGVDIRIMPFGPDEGTVGQSRKT